MFEKLDISKFNLPDSFKAEFQKRMYEKNSEHITSKASYTAIFTTIVILGSRILAEKYWVENEIVFLQHGTTKEDCEKFSKEIILIMFSEIFDNLSENVRDDVS